MKLELNVVRMANEDVIATSAVVCNHLTAAKHIFITDAGAGNYNEYTYANGTLHFQGSKQDSNLCILGGTSSGWYWFDGSNYHLCEDQNSAVHPGSN